MKAKTFGVFNTFVLRTPLFPINFYTSLLNDYSSERLFKVLENNLVKDAIKIASPELISEFDKLSNNSKQNNFQNKINLELALLKYIARLSSRATPFGIFAGCSTGELADQTLIQLDNIEIHDVVTQFDMNYWISLLKDISIKSVLQQNLVYFPNSTLYKISDFYRYVEYQYVNKKREHTLSSFRVNSFIDIIIENSKNGLKFVDIVNLISDNESEKEEAKEFILELIENQILVSELEATITGDLDVVRVVEILNKIPNYDLEKDVLNEMKMLLESKVKLSNLKHQFKSLKKLIHKFDLQFDEKYLLQTDLYKKSNNAFLNKNISFKISRALQLLGKIQKFKENANIDAFKKAFQKRYETREMPLSVVLDSELGIGYLQNTNMNDTHILLDDFSFNKGNSSINTSETWSKIDYVLEKKLKNAISASQEVVVLKDEDFDSVENKILPATFSVMLEILSKENEEIISIVSTGNVSATKLIGRFCNGNEAIHNLAKEIVAKESELHPNKILAEIVHIPQSRTGNVLRRPSLREYEIPYLGNSVLPSANQITIEDLTISIQNNRIVLKSKSLNKEIVPCLSNAHNYSYNSLPIYHFLCDLQGQSVQPITNFSWGILENHYNYFPRVIYANIILSKAKWILEYEELKALTHLPLETFQSWKKSKKLPQYVNLVQGDNTLLLNLNVEIGKQLLLNAIHVNTKIVLEEFLFDNNSVVTDNNSNSFANQFILSYYNLN